MSFREKSAMVMIAVLIIAGLFYARQAIAYPGAPVQETLVPYVLIVVLLSVVAQILLAVLSPREATEPADERERRAIDRAGHWSGMVLALGVAMTGFVYLLAPDGTTMFHLLVASMLIAQISEYCFQLALFRSAL